MEYDKNLSNILHEGFLKKDSIEELMMLILYNHDTTEYEFIQFLKDHFDYLNMDENLLEFLHSIFNNLSINRSLIDVNSPMELHNDIIYENDEDLYVDYLVDDLNTYENDNDMNDEYQV